MGQTASEIETHIEDQRENLTSNLRELERKVKTATDWHHHFDNRPMAFLGVAFGGGVLLAKIFGGHNGGRNYGPAAGRDYSYPRAASPSPRASSKPSPAAEEARHAWDNVKGALVGIAAVRLKDYVEGILPGFSAKYRRAETENAQHSARARA